MTRKMNAAGIEMLKAFEGVMDGDPSTVNLDPYLCPAGYWTIGWGHVVLDGHGRMIKGKGNEALAKAVYPSGITMDEAEKLLAQDLAIHEAAVEKLVNVPINDNQFSALVSFSFNLGANRLRDSELLDCVNAEDFEEAARQFKQWCKATNPKTKKKEVLPGLVRRREAERMLFCRPVFEAPKPIGQSQTIQGSAAVSIGTVIAGAGAAVDMAPDVIQAITQSVPQYNEVKKTTAEVFGTAFAAMLGLTVIGIGVWKVVRARLADRKKGLR